MVARKCSVLAPTFFGRLGSADGSWIEVDSLVVSVSCRYVDST